MVIARRLLVAGGASSFPAPILAAELTIPTGGGYVGSGAQNAVYVGGYTIWTYVKGNSGSTIVRRFDHSSGAVSSEVVLHSALDADDHAMPCLLLRDDGKLVTFYSAHNDTQMRMRVSTNAAPDISAWDAEVNLDSQLGGSNYTYPTAFLLSNGDIVLFFRPVAGASGQRWSWSLSTDGGTTWSAKTDFLREPSRWAYLITGQDGDRIHLSILNGVPSEDSNISIYHAYWEGGLIYKSDGTQIVASAPWAASAATLVDDYTGGDLAHSHIAAPSGQPWIVYRQFVTSSDHRYRLARWNGLSWSDAEIDDDGEWVGLRSGGICIADDSTLYVSRNVGGTMEMFRYTSTDGGATWPTSVQLTESSPDDNFFPSVPVDAQPGLRALWGAGSYTDFDTYAYGTWRAL